MSAGSVTVVVPARSEARFVASAIESVVRQTTAPSRLLLIDDGSTDDTVDVATRAAGGALEVRRQPPLGLSAARNAAMAGLESEWVLFLDADDRLRPDALASLLQASARQPEAVVVYGEAQTVDEHGVLVGAPPPPLLAPRPSGDVLSIVLERNFITSTGAALIRVPALRAVGPYREELRRAQDWEMWCRLALVGAFRYAGPRVVLEKRQRPTSISATVGLSVEEGLAAVAAAFSLPALKTRMTPAVLERKRRRQQAFHYALVGVEHLRQGRPREARAHLVQALRRDPRRAREWIVLACAAFGRLPGAVSRHLK